jgi:hypothetical protein
MADNHARLRSVARSQNLERHAVGRTTLVRSTGIGRRKMKVKRYLD